MNSYKNAGGIRGYRPLFPCLDDHLGTKLRAIMAELLDFTKPYMLQSRAVQRSVGDEIAYAFAFMVITLHGNHHGIFHESR